MSTIKDSKLANIGHEEVSWARRQMQVLEEIKNEFSSTKPLNGLSIGACMHVTKETANLMLTLKEAGANVALCCLLYTSPSPRDGLLSRMPSSA